MTDTIGAATNNRHLSAFFDTREAAEEAAGQLRRIGLLDSNIGLTGGEEFSAPMEAGAPEPKGFWESISDFLLSDDESATYSEGLRRGGYILSVRDVPDAQFDAVVDILDAEGSVDLDERSESWRAEGWTGSSTRADESLIAGKERRVVSGLTTGGAEDEVIPVIEERLRVGKRDMSLGRVKVRSYVVEEPVSEDVTLRADRVEIERRPVDRALDAGDEAFVDRTIEAEERAEEAVIQKEARVVEEIGIRKTSDERVETISDTVRHTEVEVEDNRDAARDDPKSRGV